MYSRERVLAALNHKEPDTVPVDLGGHRSTGIMASAYEKLKKYLGINVGGNYVFDMKQMISMIEEPVLKKLGIDVIPLFRKRYPPYPINPYPESWKSWRLFDGTLVQIPSNYTPQKDEKGDLVLLDEKAIMVGKMPSGGYYFDYPRPGTNPLEQIEYKKIAVEDYQPSRGFSDEELKYLQSKVEYLYKSTEYAILGDSGFLGLGDGSFRTNTNLESIGYTDWMIILLTEQEYIQEIYEKTVSFWIQNLKVYYQAVGDKICALAFADDLGTQVGELINPDLFKQLVAPYYKKVFDWIHKNTSWKVFLHSCGSIYRIIDTLIDCGVDILNPVQTSAADMEAGRLKEEFGDRLIFWGGGCDTQKTLPFGKPDEVKQEVRERIRVFAPCGGFVFNQIHNIQQGTPPENIVEMFETVSEFGKYPIRG
jgi:uroporphyrinogen decarboxylase